MALIRRLPVFPLNLVLYPSERLPLHIFEPRYVEMIGYCRRHDLPFVVVLIHDGKLAHVGCTARVRGVVNAYSDGRMDILTIGEDRVRVLDLYSDMSYLTADVEEVAEPEEVPNVPARERLITQHMRLLELAGRTVRPSLYQDVDRVSYVIAPNAGLDVEQKQHVLELSGENERRDYLIRYLEAVIPRVEKLEDLRRKISSNGHFKDFPPEG